MRKTKIFAAISGVGLAVASIFFIAADHVDAPAVSGTKTDIADLFAFEGTNSNNTVLIATLQGALVSGDQTTNAQFDEDVMIEFNIDNTGDFIEDLVIQAVRRGDSMYFFGPAAPAETGLESSVITFASRTAVKISTSEAAQTATSTTNMSVFAGPRRDPFFMDFNRFNLVASGAVAPEGFLPPAEASDFFADLNVLAIAVEVPNSMLGTAPTHVAVENLPDLFAAGSIPDSYNVWVTTSRKQ
ncbi:DUF4331 family protein [Patiriisocius sp. Uisw_017]|jgi:hypothetical protein|uniref:DUF4331 family protein n=1 Tax=Patiriisocius sp. Uisw_017 TaxID=3230968 RepID=UPI0039EC6E2E